MDLVEKFKTMSIHRDTPMFPPRPGFGVAGTPCLVTANHFFTGVVDKGLHHYDVAITPEPTLKAVYRKIISKLVTDHESTDFGGRLPAYDGSRSLFTAGELPFKSKQFDVTLAGRDDRKYTVAIKHATVVSLDQLMMLMGGRATDIPMQALQVLDIVLRDIVLNERQDMGYLAVGRSFFSPVIDVPTDLGQGVQGWKGFYQSIRPTQNGLSVVLDISSTAFIEPLPLIDFVKKILGKNPAAPFTAITSLDYVKMKKALRGVRIEVTHRGDQRRKYKIANLTLTRTSQLTFEASPGVSKTVVEYFRETYGLNLQYDFLPSVQVGSEQRPNYLPMEVCKIVPGQHYKKKLDDTQVKALMSSTCRRPNDREKDICRIVERNEYNSTRRANEFGIEVDYNPTSVQARILPAPTLKYHATGSETSCCPEKGSWNMRSKKVVDGARIRNWACVNFCGTLQQNEAQNFCSQLARMCSNSGVRIDSNPRMFRITSPNTEAELRGIHQTMWTSLGGQKIDLLLAILPNGNGSLYGYVVASLDWPEVAKYNGVVRAQGHRVEIINGLEDIVKELLLSFQKENGKPQQLIFYRDGVSEGQFKQVLEQEIPEIEKGTSRPTHYHVLRDDNKFTADSLQSLTYNLCYTYSSCCRSVSIAPPAYYAHKLAFRARMYMSQASDAASVSSHASSAHAAAPRKLPEIKNELKRFMFYC
ncbi:hypothetical protein EJB05_12759 [Eragrostis curvula]|uniref:Piwi domain-containing protein n=1 Tax=Eragrostis curvula TaxID=38414 RepID=A0A5J9VUN9_9POAL|nr:hypothetical protein EJB05_12759 [Eragrostis curvula]